MYCPSCHKKVQSSFAKCPYCSMSFIKQSAIEPKSYPDSSIFSKLKKFTLISLSVLGGLFILLIVVTINSTPSFTPSSTSTSEEYTNQSEEAEPEPYLEKNNLRYQFQCLMNMKIIAIFFFLVYLKVTLKVSHIYERGLNTMHMERWKLIVERIRSEKLLQKTKQALIH